jgi:predicted nuclease of predicted toxin-antitoxin system
VVALAEQSGRVLVSEDYGFGELVVRHRLQLPGLVIIGCSAIAPSLRPARVLSALGEMDGDLVDHLTIIEPLRIRRRRLR